jgi:hypothetical protein
MSWDVLYTISLGVKPGENVGFDLPVADKTVLKM